MTTFEVTIGLTLVKIIKELANNTIVIQPFCNVVPLELFMPLLMLKMKIDQLSPGNVFMTEEAACFLNQKNKTPVYLNLNSTRVCISYCRVSLPLHPFLPSQTTKHRLVYVTVLREHFLYTVNKLHS